MKNGIFICLLLIILGCQGSPQQSDFDFDNTFFDLAAFFKNEIDKNQSQVKSIKKNTFVNGESSPTILDTIDFSKELKLFLESDINKISWADRYQIDTISVSSDKFQIVYSALVENLQTRKIAIDFEKEIPKTIYIHNQLKSMIMDTDQHLTYIPDVGYDIAIQQHGKLQAGNKYATSVRFNK